MEVQRNPVHHSNVCTTQGRYIALHYHAMKLVLALINCESNTVYQARKIAITSGQLVCCLKSWNIYYMTLAW